MEADAAPGQNRTARDFGGRTVLSFESRRAAEIAALIERNGGRAIVAPSTREVAAATSADVSRFVTALLEKKIDVIIFLTGVGAKALARAVEPFCTAEQFVRSLKAIPVLARGPKPLAALKELGVPVTWNVPEPNTWREILQVLDRNVELEGKLVAVQEYGVTSQPLIDGLAARSARVIPVHVYDWALPEDIAPLKRAVEALVGSEVDIVLFTAGIQAHHLLQVAEQMGSRDAVIAALRRTKVASIGPVTSEVLGEFGIPVTMEPSHPKMGYLVKEATQL